MSRLTGLAVADVSGTIQTFDQLQGNGVVRNKALVIPAHLHQLNPAIHSIEYVSVAPGAEIGEHQQRTDEIYVIQRGTGVLCSNGVKEMAASGSLAIAPRRTWHTLRNSSAITSLDFLVIEVETQQDIFRSPVTLHLFSQLQASDAFGVVRVGQRPVLPRIAAVDLAHYCTGPWGQLSFVEVPEGGRVEPYTRCCEENLFLLDGHMTVMIGEERFDSDGIGLNVFLPRQVPRAVFNRSSVQPLLFLSVQFPATDEEDEDAAE